MIHDRVLIETVLDHLAGKPGMIEKITQMRRCKVARAYQIVNEVVHMALNHVPNVMDKNYNHKRHPNLIGYFLRKKEERLRVGWVEMKNTPEAFYTSCEIDYDGTGENKAERLIFSWDDLFRSDLGL